METAAAKVSEAMSAKGEMQARLLLDSVTGYAIYMLNADGIVSTWNPGAERNKGYTAAEIQGRHFSVFYTEPDRQKGEPARALSTALDTGRFEAEGWRVRKDGSRFWAGVVIQPIYSAGELIGFAKITRDLSEQRDLSDKLADVHRNLRIALEHMSQGLALFNEHGSLVLVNARWTEAFSREGEVRSGMPMAAVLQATGLDTIQAYRIEERVRRLKGGQPVDTFIEEIGCGSYVSILTTPIPDSGWVLTVSDITQQRRSDEKLAHMAHHDAMTGLPNRVLFQSQLRQAIQGTRRARPFALLSLDLNGFKAVNDTYGHAAGDELLCSVAKRLQASVREVDLVARLGGDEFAIIQTDALQEEAETLPRRLTAILAEPYTIHGLRVTAGSAVGIALAPLHGQDPDDLVKKADLALYKAKEHKGTSHVVFSPDLALQYDSRNLLERDLRLALKRDEFQLYYQPLADAVSSQVTGYEALVRWIHPERGVVSPADFIPVAEETGLIIPLGEWVLRTACAEAATWEEEQRIAVNLSPIQFRNEDLTNTVVRALADSGLAPGRLEIEVTESVLLHNTEATLKILHRLQSIGVRIALDDFGTGYSSLSYSAASPSTSSKSIAASFRTSPTARNREPSSRQSRLLARASTCPSRRKAWRMSSSWRFCGRKGATRFRAT